LQLLSICVGMAMATLSIDSKLRLKSGFEMPTLGFGVSSIFQKEVS
jgi:hypothetical protein